MRMLFHGLLLIKACSNGHAIVCLKLNYRYMQAHLKREHGMRLHVHVLGFSASSLSLTHNAPEMADT
jgi:hypothetical protein